MEKYNSEELNNIITDLTNKNAALENKITAVEAELLQQDKDSQKYINDVRDSMKKDIDNIAEIAEGTKNDVNREIQNILGAFVLAIITYFIQHL